MKEELYETARSMIEQGYVPLGWISRELINTCGFDGDALTDEQLMAVADNMVEPIYDEVATHVDGAMRTVLGNK